MNSRLLSFVAAFLAWAPLMAQEWVNPQPDILTSYIYAPGVLGSEIQMGRYCPTFVASTGETITCSKGIEVINLPASSNNFGEISLKQIKKHKKNCTIAKPAQNQKNSFLTNFFMAPFKAIWHILSSLGNRVFGFKIKKAAEPSGESLRSYWADPAKVNLAQEKDLAVFKELYEYHTKTITANCRKKHVIVLYGTSRGSATVFNFNALKHPEQVRAVICEGLFDSIAHVAQATRSSWIKFLIKLLPKVSEFKEDGILPIKLIDKVPTNVPILLITSRKDTTVPWQCTMNIYKQLRAAGHKKVHILVLKKAGHAWYPQCSKHEKALYQNVVHAFYKHYGLPYIAKYAQLGKDYFEQETQPDPALIME